MRRRGGRGGPHRMLMMLRGLGRPFCSASCFARRAGRERGCERDEGKGAGRNERKGSLDSEILDSETSATRAGSGCGSCVNGRTDKRTDGERNPFGQDARQAQVGELRASGRGWRWRRQRRRGQLRVCGPSRAPVLPPRAPRGVTQAMTLEHHYHSLLHLLFC